MKRRFVPVALVAWTVFAILTLSTTNLRSAEPQPPQAAAPAVVPQGEPRQISDWALAGVLWSDAHLVRRLATAASQHPEAGEQAATLQSVAAQTEQLINSLESFGWKRIAQAEAAPQTAAAPTDAVDPATPDLRPALQDRVVQPRPPRQPAEPEASPVPTERSPRLQEQVEVEAARSAGAIGLEAEVRPPGGAIAAQRYRVGVGDYIDQTPVEALSRGDAVADGVEGALAAGADNVSSLPELFDPTADLVPPPVYRDVDVIRPPVTEPAEPVIERLSDPDPTVDAPPAPPLRLDRYTDRSAQYAQDAPWVQFRLDANQQRWRMLESEAEPIPLSRIVEQLRGALMQLRADAAVTRRAASGSELADIVARFGGN